VTTSEMTDWGILVLVAAGQVSQWFQTRRACRAEMKRINELFRERTR